MLGNFLKCEANKNNQYYRVIQAEKEYEDGRKFPMDEEVVSDLKIDLNATDRNKIGGFYISTYEYVFRWLIRGDTLCEVKIPEDSKIYETVSENGIFVSEKIILTNPQKIDDNLAMKLYLNSTLPEVSYFKAMTACAIMGYVNTTLKVCEDKVNKDNVDTAIAEFENFCERRKSENNIYDISNKELVKILKEKLRDIQKMG